MTATPDQPSELVLTESRTMRAQTAGRVDVLDKVKAIALLPDDVHATTEIVAAYYEVDPKTIDSVVARNREELEGNGLRTLRGAELRSYKEETDPQGEGRLGRSGSLRLFTRRTILNVGQLLVESPIARQVRTYLLNVEESTAPELRVQSVERAQVAQARLSAMGVAKQFGLVNPSYIEAMARTELARMSGEEPDIDPADITITCDEYLDGRIAKQDEQSARVRLGRTVAALYRARYDRHPQKIKRLVGGVHREVAVYTHRDADLFDTAWSEIAHHYNVQEHLGGAA